MNEVITLAGAIGTYGLYAIVAVLCVVVMYLFRKVNELHSQIQTILTNDNEKNKDLLVRVTVALENSSKILERVEKHLDN